MYFLFQMNEWCWFKSFRSSFLWCIILLGSLKIKFLFYLGRFSGRFPSLIIVDPLPLSLCLSRSGCDVDIRLWSLQSDLPPPPPPPGHHKLSPVLGVEWERGEVRRGDTSVAARSRAVTASTAFLIVLQLGECGEHCCLGWWWCWWC